MVLHLYIFGFNFTLASHYFLLYFTRYQSVIDWEKIILISQSLRSTDLESRYYPLPNVNGVYEVEEGQTFLTQKNVVRNNDL